MAQSSDTAHKLAQAGKDAVIDIPLKEQPAGAAGGRLCGPFVAVAGLGSVLGRRDAGRRPLHLCRAVPVRVRAAALHRAAGAAHQHGA